MSQIKWNLIIVALFATLLLLQYRLWFEAGGIRDMRKLKKNISLQKLENEKLKQQNEELTFQIARSQTNDDGTESRARNELGMIKKGEVFYQVVH